MPVIIGRSGTPPFIEVRTLRARVLDLEARVAELEAEPPEADTVAPEVTAFTVPDTASSLVVAISSFAATDAVGVTGYVVTESATQPSAAAGWTASAPTSINASGEGARTFYAWARDAAGNISEPLTASCTITIADVIAPAIQSFAVPETASSVALTGISAGATDAAGVTGWTIKSVASGATEPTATAGECSQTAGISEGALSSSSLTHTAVGTGVRDCYLFVRDAAGNVTRSSVSSVTITLEVPSTMSTASQTTGVVPLAVFFDAVDEVARTFAVNGETTFAWTSGVVQPADKEATHYAWDFGDGTAGDWSQTGLSRNTATGYVAAHVYETPGTYTATLTVTEPDGSVNTYTQQVTVSAFAGSSYYAAATPVGSANGSDAANAGSLANGWAWLNAASDRRLLLKCGDTFATSAKLTTTNGRVRNIVDAYGSGAKPIVSLSTAQDPALQLWNAHDWKVLNIEVRRSGTIVAGQDTGGIEMAGQHTDRAIVARCSSTAGFWVGMGNTQASGDAATPHDANCWFENEVTGNHGANHIYCGGRRLMVLGNNLHDQQFSHIFRTYQTHKGAISHNRLYNPGTDRGALKLGGMTYNTAWPKTYYVVISDNLERGVGYSTSIGPQNTAEDERLSHVVLERNRFRCNPTHPGYPGVSAHITVEAHDVMVRNNVFDLTDSYGKSKAVYLNTMHLGAPPAAGTDTVRILNNTVVQRTSPGGDNAVYVATFQGGTEDIANVTIQNNVLFAPNTGTVALRELEDERATEGTGYAASNNLVDPGVSPFTDLAGEDYTLAVGSAALGAGLATAAVREDFARNERPSESPDIGAYEAA